MKNILIPAAAMAVASLSTFVAVAPGYAASGTPNAIAVSYADLDLSQMQDRRTLAERVADAAREVCGRDYSPLLRTAQRDCRNEAVARATAQLGLPESAIE